MPRDLLRLDSLAGLSAGALMLALSGWLSTLYALPRSTLVVVGIANVVYGSCSGLLARCPYRPPVLIVALVVANGAWAMLCLLAAWHYRATASVFGVAQFVAEGLFVGGLAVAEWRARARLTAA